MGKISVANLKKTIYYLRRNGLKNTCYAVRERLDEKRNAPYSFTPVTEEELAFQRQASQSLATTFSIVVPAYRTGETYLRELVTSVARQTYSKWELIIADATEDDSVKAALERIAGEEKIPLFDYTATAWQDSCIRYVRLKDNAGIAENTNQGLGAAGGDYIGLLDHDDVLTENALYEMAAAIEKGKQSGVEVKLLYSDEDKCNSDRTKYFEPNFKEKFNLDLILSNNYICHFMVMEAALMKELGFRQEYNGAQDYDLTLRAAERLLDNEAQIVHIPLVLYHWRCHAASTAENPQSKQYAYDAGLRALQDFADRQGWSAKAVPLKHLGFYTLQYEGGPLCARSDIGAVGGRLVEGFGEKIVGGRMSETGEIFYQGLPKAYSGYLHRAVLTQDAAALDIRCIQVKEELHVLFK